MPCSPTELHQHASMRSLDAHARAVHSTVTALVRARHNTQHCAACVKYCSSQFSLVRHIASWKPSSLDVYIRHMPPLSAEERHVMADLDQELARR
eukprot:2701579-Pyramimonas_sp.AAC.1